MNLISSKDNELVKKIKKLKDKKYRDLDNLYIIEGIKMIKEAISESANIQKIIICDDYNTQDYISKELMYEIAKYNCVYITNAVLKYISDVKSPQGIMAIVEKESGNAEVDYTKDIIVVLDNVQDPGNVGTILRTLDSIGINQLIVSKGTVDIYNPKVVRATMGAIFRVKVIECESLIKFVKNAKKHKFKTVVTCLNTKNVLYDISYKKKIIVIGNEATGVSKELIEIADEKIKIPMFGKAESLNASVATGIVLYEYVRQNFIGK